MTMTAREKLLACIERRYKVVSAPGGMTFTIRSLTEKERANLEIRAIDHKTSQLSLPKMAESKLRMLANCIVDEQTKEPAIKENEWQLLEPLDSAVVACLYSACLKHCGYEDAEVEELAGNSD